MAHSVIKDKYRQNKLHYESAVAVGKYLFELILQISDPEIKTFKDKLGMSKNQIKKTFNKDEIKLLEMEVGYYDFEKIDLSLIHKLVYQICDLEKKAPELQKNLQALKEHRNVISHIADITKFTDMFVWQKIEELRVLFENILNGIEHLYHTDVVVKNKEINSELDKILKNIEVEVTDSELETFLKEISGVEKCPINVKIKVTNCQVHCSELMTLVERVAKENTRVKLLVPKAFFDSVELHFYDSQTYLTPLLDKNSKCKLIWYRGNLSNEMISMLPATLEQLFIRIRSDQIELLNRQLPQLNAKLWSLVLYLELPEDIDPASLPLVDFKGRQMGLKFCTAITTDRIPWIVKIINRLTQGHQCDTLEFYETHLNTESDVESLLRALHEAEVHVTTWVKLQNEASKDCLEENRLNILAQNLNLRMFRFLNPPSYYNQESTFRRSRTLRVPRNVTTNSSVRPKSDTFVMTNFEG
ncbi:unnamed protein product [Meganyctiphanes norvegica]|uniref:DZIP3-like HEPN domain-containing protein n=1 Tax=Meganyctiphanes norvegica TaxID=48144 RepID=A0AAV2S5M2_MEGNR